MIRVTKSFRLRHDLIRKIQTKADEQNRSFNNLVETILNNAFNEEEELNKLLGY